MTRLFTTLALVAISAVATTFGYRLLRAEAVEDIYRDRLREFAASHADLAKRYNNAVRQTAVTELIVSDGGELSVRVKNADGALRTMPTPFDPESEIYVDYAVKDGRLWIRRVFDEHTPPAFAVQLNPSIADLDWADDSLRYGKAVYRGGLTPGVWTVSVTGSGALGLAKTDDVSDLAEAPSISDFEEVEVELDREIEGVSFAEVWSRLFGS